MTTSVHKLIRAAEERAVRDGKVSSTVTYGDLAYAAEGPGELVPDAPRIRRWAAQALNCALAAADGTVLGRFSQYDQFERLDATLLRRKYAEIVHRDTSAKVPEPSAFADAAELLRADAKRIAEGRS
jgi:hypothetical protein